VLTAPSAQSTTIAGNGDPIAAAEVAGADVAAMIAGDRR
jgi:hypothetical protein